MKYFLGLGSNLGEKTNNLITAVEHLKKEKIVIRNFSSFYKTQPRDYLDQPWFINMVIEIQTDLEPGSFLTFIQRIEKKMGRKASIPKGPRIIDMDILLNEDLVIESQCLTIPHPRMHERNFVLVPLKEIAPDIVHPVLKINIEELYRRCEDRSKVDLYKKWREVNG